MTPETNPLNLIAQYPKADMPHTVGLSRGAVACLRAGKSLCDGKTAVIVYRHRVLLCALCCPYNFRSWRVEESYPYDTIEDLRTVLDDLTATPQASCWDGL